MFDPVTKPEHYNSHPSGIETISITRHFLFCLGNTVKYILRHNLKGNPRQDLEKALWYLDDYIKHADPDVPYFNDIAFDNLERLIGHERLYPSLPASLIEALYCILYGDLQAAREFIAKAIDELAAEE